MGLGQAVGADGRGWGSWGPLTSFRMSGWASEPRSRSESLLPHRTPAERGASLPAASRPVLSLASSSEGAV